MENSDSIYSLLIGISQDVGEFKSEVKNLNSDIKELSARLDNYNKTWTEQNEKTTAKIEEYFDYAKKRQDSIKEELVIKINDHETRIKAIENRAKNKLWTFVEKFKGAIVSAVILALVGACMKFATEVIKVIKM